MNLNKVFEIEDIAVGGGLYQEAVELGVVFQLLRKRGIPVGWHRIRLWEWPLLAHVGNPKPGDKILDVGAGNSPLIHWFKSRGCECWACDLLDFEPKITEYCKFTGVELVKANIFDLPFEDGFFDYVMSTCVLEHVANLRIEDRNPFRQSVARALEECLRILKPGRLTAHTIDFRVIGFNGLSQFNIRDITAIVGLIEGKAKQVGGVDYNIAEPLRYYLKEDPIYSPDSPSSKAIKSCLRLGIIPQDAWIRSCASLILEKRLENE